MSSTLLPIPSKRLRDLDHQSISPPTRERAAKGTDDINNVVISTPAVVIIWRYRMFPQLARGEEHELTTATATERRRRIL
jgi:hypothetical protein